MSQSRNLLLTFRKKRRLLVSKFLILSLKNQKQKIIFEEFLSEFPGNEGQQAQINNQIKISLFVNFVIKSEKVIKHVNKPINTISNIPFFNT
ncbi:hypothetical protein BpHYR1_017370 [Brachionus plicatilis]|uniref:Uncharacterized protein n=1 Tax=Brachionus plicatilis TaxID=10195 RepID=A0A3M7QUM0_BRAPC|nr:hypothetical protein BpHYR1_017370 [Brachionus plicatilis]